MEELKDKRVVALHKPPVNCSTMVRSTLEHTFDAFVRRIGEWWPADPFSAGRERVRDVTIERLLGGRVYETWDDGSVVEWGELTAWDPPSGFSMTWGGTPVPTLVEFHFRAVAPALTRVTVEHRGWEAMTDEQLSEDCALPGGYTGGAYVEGWNRCLDAFAACMRSGG